MSNLAEKNLPYADFEPSFKVRSIGEILVDSVYSTPNDVAKALAKQSRSNATLGEILLANRGVTAFDLQNAISFQSQMKILSQPFPSISEESNFQITIQDMLKYNFAPLAWAKTQLKIAISDPSSISSIQKICTDHKIQAQFVLASRTTILSHIAIIGKKHLSDNAEETCPEGFSCRTLVKRGKNYPTLFLLPASLCFLVGSDTLRLQSLQLP